MLFRSLWTAALVIAYAGSAQAGVKFYNQTTEGGTPGDQRRISINICPPITTSLGRTDGGFIHLTDDGTGTVTMNDVSFVADAFTDLGPDILTSVFGPGGFIFIDSKLTRNLLAETNISNTSGVGPHGPSSTAPGSTTEWGIIDSWNITGENFCLSSPVTICNQNGFAHGGTIGNILPSDTYNLGTWNFDSIGDLEAETWYVSRTSNGGLSNNHDLPKAAFVGASLPALPLIGFGALALGLTVIGGRALMGKK